MVLGFFYAIFHMFQIAAIYVVVLALVDGSTSAAPAWQALVLLLVSILGRAIMNRFSQLQQTHAGYFMVANKRLHMGDKLKRIPMGYFNDQSLGELTGIATTVLDEVESAGAMVLVTILGGLINSAVMLLCVLFWDWRIGLLALAGMALYLLLLSRMEKQSAKIAPKRQRDEARLVEAVLEQLQGMSVIKSFNLTGKGDKRIRQALEDSRENNLAVEKLFTPYIWAQEMALHLFSVVILAAAVWLYLNGSSDSGQRPDGGDHFLPDLLPDPVRGQRRVRPAAGGQLHRPRQPGGRDPGDGPGRRGAPPGIPRHRVRPCGLLLRQPAHSEGCVPHHPG